MKKELKIIKRNLVSLLFVYGNLLLFICDGSSDRSSIGGPIELFLVPAMTGATNAVVCGILYVGWCI